jgi:O-antigen/teichoic acid export membrane protein
VVLFAFTRWLPAATFDWVHAREFLRRAAQLWTATVLATMHWRITQASIGIRAGAGVLGLLSVALRFDTALHGPITGPIQSLWVPVLSTLRSDRAESWRLFLRLSQLTSLLALPAFVGLGLVGPDLVAVVLDQRYEKAGDILFVLGMQGFIIPFGFFSNLIFAGLDRSDLSLKFSAVQLCITAPAVWIAAAHGPVWALGVALISMGTGTLIATWAQVRLLEGDLREFAYAMLPAYASGSFMVAVVILAMDHSPFPAGAARLAWLVILGGLAYTSWLLIFYRREIVDAWLFRSSIRGSSERALVR